MADSADLAIVGAGASGTHTLLALLETAAAARDPQFFSGIAYGDRSGRARDIRTATRENGLVKCEVAREALSARIDGEREPVPSIRVDEHLQTCSGCASWYADAQAQTGALRRLGGTGAAVEPHDSRRSADLPARSGRWWRRRS